MMRKAYLLFLAIFLFILLPKQVFADNSQLSFTLSPSGPLNPGDQYKVNMVVFEDSGKTTVCKKCPIKFLLEGDSHGQPGDEIVPSKTTTDNNGHVEVLVTSFGSVPSTGGRLLYVQVTLPDGSTTALSPILLSYRDIPIMGFMRLITSVISKGFMLPPMGDLYPYVAQQKYLGGDTRQVYLKVNDAFGVKKYLVYVFPKKEGWVKSFNDLDSWYQQHFIKNTSEGQFLLEIPAFEDLNIEILGCSSDKITNSTYKASASNGCVGPYRLQLTQLDASVKSSSNSGEVIIPGDETLKQKAEQNIAEQEKGPLSSTPAFLKTWLEEIYTSF